MVITEQALRNIIKEEYVWKLIIESQDARSLGSLVSNFILIKAPQIGEVNTDEFYEIVNRYVDEAMDSKGLDDPKLRQQVMQQTMASLQRSGIGPMSKKDMKKVLPKAKSQPEKKSFFSKLFSKQ